MFLIVSLLSTALASAAMTYGVRQYLVARKAFDLPNARSSHSVPVPRGGGVAIVVCFFLALLGAVFVGRVPPRFLSVAFAGGGLVALVGFLDDLRPLSALLRGGVHLGAAVVLVRLFPELSFFAAALSVFAVAWSINLYNFMDGIDGLAAGEAVFVCVGLAAIAAVKGDPAFQFACLSLAAASAGFLVFNWSPASIFMGDVGSGFLGGTLAAFSLTASSAGTVPMFSFLILMAVFIGDASWTLFRRLVTGQRIFEAHRTHAYQKAVIGGRSHKTVVAWVLLFNVFWLFPLAFLAAWVPTAAWPALILAYGPVLGAAISFRAGGMKTGKS